MTEVMMSLGSFRFSIETAAYEELRRNTTYDWPDQQRVGRESARQFTGISEDTIELSGRIYPTYRGGLGQVDDMRELAGRGQPLLFVDGRGRVWGKWCITRISETQRAFMANGAPRRIDFALSLQAYGADA